MSNASLAVAGLIKTYLAGMGVLEAEVVFGVMLWDAAAREGPDDYGGTPHIWLKVAGHDIDNAHIAFPESDPSALEYFYKGTYSYCRFKIHLSCTTLILDQCLELLIGSHNPVPTRYCLN